MINIFGDVLGMNFYSPYSTPFLPSNVILKWLDHYHRNLEFQRPKLGMHLASLYTADEGILERFIQEFPDISSGVIVEKEWNTTIAGIEVDDVIVECAGNKIESLLQLLDVAREREGW